MFASDAGGDWDVLVYEIGAPGGNVRVIAGGPGDQDQPSIHRTTLAFRTGQGIVAVNWELGLPLRTPDPTAPPDPSRRCQPLDPVDSPVVSDVLAAWQCGVAGARTIVVARFPGGLEEYEVASTGDRFGASASGALVAFVDASDGSVWLHDSSPLTRRTSRVTGGRATGVSVGSIGVPVVAVARASGKPDADIEIWDPTGGLGTAGRVAALIVPGEQRNPHLSADWVAFEDLSTGRSQVVLWQWTTGLVFLPHPSASNQTLNDLSVLSATEVRVVFADDGDGTGTTHHIALYRLAYVNGSIPDDGTPIDLPWTPPPQPPPARPPPATCDDDAVQVLGTLSQVRRTGKPFTDHLRFTAVPFACDPVLPLLVCVDLEHVSSGWITLDDRTIATPDDFRPQLGHLEAHATVGPGEHCLSASIAGKPGSRLRARVIADPGRLEPQVACSTAGAKGGSAAAAPTVPAPGAGAGAGALQGGGCGTGTGAGAPGAIVLLALALRRRQARGG